MQQSVINKRRNESGVFLVELALVILVMGFAIAVSMPLYSSYSQRNSLLQNNKRIDIIAKALSNYTQNRFRLPCPADSTPAAGELYGVERVAGCLGVVADRHGIVPYRTLGLPEQYAKDAYGNFFTYVVSRDFVTDNRFNVVPNTVHRRLAHLVAGDNTTGNYALMPKSQFCAPINFNVADDVVVNQGIPAVPLYDQVRDSVGALTTTRAAGPNANLANRDLNVTTVAVAIVSHGANGAGAYQADGTQSPVIAGNVAEMATVAQDNIIHVESEFSEGVGNNYDDITKFYTQDEVYALSGGNSCEHL